MLDDVGHKVFFKVYINELSIFAGDQYSWDPETNNNGLMKEFSTYKHYGVCNSLCFHLFSHVVYDYYQKSNITSSG